MALPSYWKFQIEIEFLVMKGGGGGWGGSHFFCPNALKISENMR